MPDIMGPNLTENASTQYGKLLSNPPPGEEIIISGISGKFPLSSDIEEFKHNLYNKIDMITHDPHEVHPEMPSGLGKLKTGEVQSFDQGFFGIHRPQVLTMIEGLKLLLERCVECIFDAGLNPSDLEGTNTGVFLGICFIESTVHWVYEQPEKNGYAMLSNMAGMVANRISYFLKLKGPSFNCDTACSSTLYALDGAYKAIRNGQVDQAIVCGANVLLAPGATLQFARLGVLSKEGILRAFDDNGTGYVRAEAASAILLQKAKNCNRIYAKILHTKTNCDGYKEEGITYPSGQAQLSLLKEIYSENGVNPRDITFLEAHGTGTVVGDPEELNCIDKFFTQDRTTPLLIGSVKSGIGHTEPVSGLCSIVKAILSFENNLIPPNVNFKTPRKQALGLIEGRMKVVVEKTPLPDQNGLIGISSFGFGGGNAHVLLKWNTKEKCDNGILKNSFPTIICVSGRTKDAVDCLLADVTKHLDYEHVALIHNVFRKPVANHLFRGYAVVSSQGILRQSVQRFNPGINNFLIHFGKISGRVGNFIQELLQLSILSDFKNRIQKFLSKKQIDLHKMLFNSATSQLLSDSLLLLCIAELLKVLEIKFNGASGLSIGELISAYFMNNISLEEVLECIYAVSEFVNDVEYLENNNKYEIQKKFERILNGKKYYNDNGPMRITPELLTNAIFKEKHNYGIVPKKSSVILVIGQSLSELKTRKLPIINYDINEGFQGVLEVLGRLYEYGLHPQVQKLYPQVQFPVSRGTPMISTKIKWKHDYKHFVPSFTVNLRRNTGWVSVKFTIDLQDEQWADLSGHIVDGRNLFPATGYLYIVWYLTGWIQGIDLSKLKVCFENCKFKRACTLSSKTSLQLCVMIQKVSGNFEITEEDALVVTGRIKLAYDFSESKLNKPIEGALGKDLSTRDIYKELRLRGYHYRGVFSSLLECSQNGTSGKIRWADNWIAFMDNMLQMQILAEDTRLLYVPTSIARLTIDPIAHLDKVEDLLSNDESEFAEVPVQYNPSSGIISSAGIEIRGLLASSIPRKKTTAFPVLEKYQFIPNVSKLTLEESIRVFMQVALENNSGFKINAAELLDEASKDVKLIGPIIQEALGDQPLVHCDLIVHTANNLELDVSIKNEQLKSGSEYSVVVGSELLSRKEILDQAVNATVEDGFILSRELPTGNCIMSDLSNLIILNISETNEEKLVFMKKQSKNDGAKDRVYVNVTMKDSTFDWIQKLKTALKKNCDIVAWCQNEPLNGVLGLINCLRREPNCQKARSMFILDEAPAFDPAHPFYQKQLNKNMTVNVYCKGQWGTYRHLLLNQLVQVENTHCYVNTTTRGDLSSFRWIEGPLTPNTQLDKHSLVSVYYSSLNFRDVMTASGRINVDVITRDRREQECVQGFEFSGKIKCGQRVMGIITQGALATLVKAEKNLLWEVPSTWSLKDAATVPVVYGTCLYALVVVGKIKPSDSILIHSGTGGIGQAAINLCLDMGCTVFTTVGTEEKREFIKNNFPKIHVSHIGNSRDLSFKQMIMKETNGKGVDIVLNSLAEEKLFSSVRCLAAGGRFLEIGKFDLANNKEINLQYFKNGASYHGVMLDKLFNESESVKMELKALVQKYIDSGAVKPLMTNVFKMDEVEQAFRFMASGKHMGKVLVEVRNEDECSTIQKVSFKGLPRYYCNPKKSYIICGGLGGFGLELADWLILRGAKNLILTSRKGIKTGYQTYRISIWKNYGCNIKISTQDITSKAGCIGLIKEANSIAPVDAIFNLAVVLEDSILYNQTKESFNISFGPKAYATQYLDEISRTLCPELRDFVVFSSVSCGRGNAGQTNYGMANSVMERICEKRRGEGYPALAIQWGAVGDVGLVAELQESHIELEIGGTLQQSIASCLQVMDELLRQSEAVIVSSMVVAEKRALSASGNIEDIIVAILGIRDIKSISMNSTLAELGMDSITAVEVKQTLEREYNIFLSPSEMRSITLGKIKELQEKSSEGVLSAEQDNSELFDMDFTQIHRGKSLFSKLRSKDTDKAVNMLSKIIAIPGIEGYCDVLENLTENLDANVYGINYGLSEHNDSYSQMADMLLPTIEEFLKPHKSFNIIGHSMGSLLALEIVSRLEKLEYKGALILLDGSPKPMKNIAASLLKSDEGLNKSKIEDVIINVTLRNKLNIIELENAMQDISKCLTLREKLVTMYKKLNQDKTLVEDMTLKAAEATTKRVKASVEYTPTFKTVNSKVTLFKPTIMSICGDCDDLSQYCTQPVETRTFQGTHNSFVADKEMARAIMENLLVVPTDTDE